MMETGERGVSFGQDASTYDRARPPYPDLVADRVLALTGVSTAVEIGAGTGLATRAFARPGIQITCVEPDEAMASVLVARDLPGVDVVVSTFEEWAGPSTPVDLVLAAQSWHWLDRETACGRAREWLRPGGALALVWNVPQHRYEKFVGVYAEHAPHLLEESDSRITFRDSEVWLDDLSAAGLERVELFIHTWTQTLSVSELRLLYSTYSDHILLETPVRERLLDALETEVADQGGLVDIEYETRIFSGISPAS